MTSAGHTMKLVAKYTLALGATLVVVLSFVAYLRLSYTRHQIEDDLRRNHRMVGRVLQAGVADVWLDAEGMLHDRALATRETEELIARANTTVDSNIFTWSPDASGGESQQIVGHEFVSRFPVTAAAERVGTIIAHESLHQLDEHVRDQALFSAAEIALIVVLGVIASIVMGAWLVGRPIALLIQQARRIGRKELSQEVALRRRDELGELAIEMNAASKALDAALKKTEQETAARLRAVEQMRHSDRLSTVGKLAAGIAHELGTPLSIVGGHAQMIAEGEVTGDKAIASARAIDAETTRMGAIVRQLLDFARRRGPEGSTSESNEIARRALGLLSVMIERASVRAELELAESLPRALIDEESLHQVLANLIVNAVQAMPKGGTLRVRTSRFTGAPPDAPDAQQRCVRIDVRDTGGGIPTDVKERIFEPFFTTKRVGDGTGLGLAVVHGIVSDHHGWITVDTSPAGTTFSIFLQEAP